MPSGIIILKPIGIIQKSNSIIQMLSVNILMPSDILMPTDAVNMFIDIILMPSGIIIHKPNSIIQMPSI